MDIISFEHANDLGLKRYFTGLPCKHGHTVERKVSDKSCVECNKLKSQRHAPKSREWYYNNKEYAQAQNHINYENNTEAYKKRARQHEQDNPERTKELKTNYRLSEKGLAQSRNWVAKNPVAHSGYTKDWKSRHPELVAEYVGTRRATKLSATPLWLTQEDRIEIRTFYTEAKQREQETGKKYHVDHIIPLQHKSVCGLHVPWNLQVLTESENAAKGNRFAS